MKQSLMIGAALAVLAGAGVAVAQQAPAAPPPPDMARPEGPRPEMGPHGPHGMRGMRGMEGMRGMRPSKAASFMFRRGDAVIAIKCADDEPMKACVDASAALLDKLPK